MPSSVFGMNSHLVCDSFIGAINSDFALRLADMDEGVPGARAEVTLNLRSSFALSRQCVISFFGFYS
jgi:hypothetical protein